MNDFKDNIFLRGIEFLYEYEYDFECHRIAAVRIKFSLYSHDNEVLEITEDSTGYVSYEGAINLIMKRFEKTFKVRGDKN